MNRVRPTIFEFPYTKFFHYAVVRPAPPHTESHSLCTACFVRFLLYSPFFTSLFFLSPLRPPSAPLNVFTLGSLICISNTFKTPQRHDGTTLSQQTRHHCAPLTLFSFLYILPSIPRVFTPHSPPPFPPNKKINKTDHPHPPSTATPNYSPQGRYRHFPRTRPAHLQHQRVLRHC